MRRPPLTSPPPATPARTGRAYAFSFAALVVVWLALDGTGSLLVGVLFALLGAGAGLWLAPPGRSGVAWSRLPRFAAYFVYESFRGGADVLWRAFHPRLPIRPALHTYPLHLPAGTARTLFVGTVSLLPGTLSVRLHDAEDRLVVHSLAGEPHAGLDVLQRQVARLFAHPLPPRS